jgi:hypothetical protein
LVDGTVKHSASVSHPNDPSYDVSATAWVASHVIDEGSGRLYRGADAAKAAFTALKGCGYYATDTKILYQGDGANWVEICRAELATRLVQLAEKAHASLTGVSEDQHHAKLHKADHQDGGTDEIVVTGLSGLLADGQTPLAHKTSHQLGGSDALSLTGLSGLLATAQNPVAHASTHAKSGSDPLSTGVPGTITEGDAPAEGTSNYFSRMDHKHGAPANYTPKAHKPSHVTGGSDTFADSDLISAKARIDVKNNGALVGTRRGINLIPGSYVTIVPVDDLANDDVDITISSTGGGGGSETCNHATIPINALSIDVTHLLGYAPDLDRLKLTARDNLGGRSFWVEAHPSFPATYFLIKINVPDTVAHLFSWAYSA